MREYFYSILTNNKSLVLADQVIFSGCGFVIILLLVRILSPINFGIYASLLLFIYFLVSVSNAIVIQPLQVTLAKIKKDSNYLSFAFYVQLLLTALLAISTFALLQIEIEFLNKLYGSSFSIILFLSCFLLHDFFRKVFLAKGTIRKALSVDCITSFIQVGLFTYAFLNVELGLSEVIFIMGISYLPGILVSIYFLKPTLRLRRNWKPYFQTHVIQGKWLLMTAVLQWWANNLFVIASGIFLGPTALGAFRLVQSIFGVLNLLFQTFENYALPFVSRLFQSSVERSKVYLRNMNVKGALIVGSLLLLLFLFSEFFIVLVAGESYLEYAFLVKGMAILYFVIFVGYPTRIAIRMMELNHFFFMGYVLSFLFSLSSFHFLLKEWHLWGAIIGLISNQLILISFWQYVLFKNHFVLWK
ncbi:MAG: O-antigen/teichoic acid export membrane protein [Polaribacter sp.]|jgi:O-antigen/teichoic acid export membrane protein